MHAYFDEMECKSRYGAFCQSSLFDPFAPTLDDPFQEKGSILFNTRTRITEHNLRPGRWLDSQGQACVDAPRVRRADFLPPDFCRFAHGPVTGWPVAGVQGDRLELAHQNAAC